MGAMRSRGTCLVGADRLEQAMLALVISCENQVSLSCLLSMPCARSRARLWCGTAVCFG